MVPKLKFIGIFLCPIGEIGAPRLAGRRPEFGLVGLNYGSFIFQRFKIVTKSMSLIILLAGKALRAG